MLKKSLNDAISWSDLSYKSALQRSSSGRPNRRIGSSKNEKFIGLKKEYGPAHLKHWRPVHLQTALSLFMWANAGLPTGVNITLEIQQYPLAKTYDSIKNRETIQTYPFNVRR